MSAPQVSTIPATSITATTVSLNGSVSTQGEPTSCWFEYGPTTEYGSTTPTVSVGSGPYPVTVVAEVSGLNGGSTYHFSLVAENNDGLVMGPDLTFIATNQPTTTNANAVPLSLSAPAPQPHFAWPFTITPDGAVVNQQDSLGDVFSSVQTIAFCPIGSCPEIPALGIPDLTFAQAPLGAGPVVAAIEDQEPRASELDVASAFGDDADTGQWYVTLTTRVLATDGNVAQGDVTA